MPEEQAGLGWGDKQRALRRQQTPEDADRAILRGAVEIDQQVPAEDDIVEVPPCQKIGRKHVGLKKVHLPAHRVAQTMPEGRGFEMTVAERQLLTAE